MQQSLSSQNAIFQNVENIPSLIENIAIKSNIPKEQIFIKILRIKNFIKMPEEKSFELVDEISEEIFENKGTQIKQTYDVKIYKKIKRDFHITLHNNAQSLEITFKQNFEVPKNIDDFEALLQEILALQIMENVILKDLDSQKNLLYEKLKSVESPLKNDLRFILMESKNFVDSKDGELVFEIDGIDLSKKNIIALKQGVKICIYKLATNGKAGRNLQGDFITPEAKTSLPPSNSDEIRKVENDGFYEYFSNKNGFVILADNHFSFNNEINLQNVELKDNYNFLGDLDTDSRIVISTNDEFEDALKNGVSLKANTINISGNLGANTQLEAREVNISGQTHKSTMINAQNATINVLRGRLECDNANIESLEGGSISSENLTINKANGGEITANTINIIEVFSTNSIKFSTKLIINSLKGGDNKIIFTPLANKQTKQKIESLLKDLESKQQLEKQLQSKENALIYKYNKFHQTARDLKAQIADDKAKNRKSPDYVIENYKAFLEIVNSLKATKLSLQDNTKEQHYIINTIREYQQNIFSAEFLCKDGWLKYNDVIFELVSPKTYQAKTIIKGIGKYYFDIKQKSIIHQKIFTSENEEINNQGF